MGADPDSDSPHTLLGVQRGAEDSTVIGGAGGSRVGVFGGTFDPVHLGHLLVALEVRHALRLDRMMLVVANDPWQKGGETVSAAADRFALTCAAVEEMNARLGREILEASDIEIARGGETYSADTLEELHASIDDPRLFLLVGSDAAAGLATWKRPDTVRALATTVVVERGGREGGRPPDGWPHLVVEVPLMDVSSSDLRVRFAHGRPVEAMVPPSVVDGVRQRGLYRSDP